MSALTAAFPAQGQEVEGRTWLEALIYLKNRGANSEMDLLRAEALKARRDDLELAEAFLETLVARKDRPQLNTYVQELVEANECRSLRAAGSRFCVGLKSFWSEQLASLWFFESSAPRWEKARRALDSGDCRVAQAELREIEAREGSFMALISQKALVAKCLGETETAAALSQELEKLRF